MQFRIMDARPEKRRAQAALVGQLQGSAKRFRKVVSWRDGNQEFDVYWHALEQFWSVSDEKQDPTVYWDFYGTDNPEEAKVLYMSCQSTTQQEGNLRKHGGLFLADADENMYLAHTGMIGGGVKGVGKNTFVREYRGGNWHTIRWPDDVETDVVVVGRIGGPDFPAQLGRFAREVDRVKAVGKLQGAGVRTRGPSAGSFNPEFTGKRCPHAAGGAIESECYHGSVVNTLHDEVERLLGREPANDQPRDLYLTDESGRVELLIEVKTDLSTGSIYQAIGQLFFNGYAENHMTKLVLAVPGTPKARTKRILDDLRIHVLSYHWSESEPIFDNLQKALT